ncbi:hypothetical protein FB446DRAFT_59938 [Lentinula raphanica]|nr:hypothetical protein FB446DRAFT_59938 [Lentinula raphanica]
MHALNGTTDYHRQTRTSLVSEEERSDRAELRGLEMPEQEFMISPLPEFTSNALAADTFINLPDDDGSSDSPRSYNSVSIPQSPPEGVSNPPTAPVTPSLLSLTAPKYDEAGHRGSRTHPFPSREAIPTRPASPVVRPIEDPPMPSTLPNPLERNSLLRNHLYDLLTDTPPNVASSLPNTMEQSSSSYDASYSSHRQSPRRSMPSRSLENPSSPPPIPIPSVQPTTSITIAGSIHPNSSLSNRPALSRASSHAVAMENAQREKRKTERTIDTSERSREPVESPTLLSSSPSVKMSSSPRPPTSFADSERSRQHQPGRRSPNTLNVPRDNNEHVSSSPVNRHGPSEPERSSNVSRPIGISHSSSKRDLSRSHKPYEGDGIPSSFVSGSIGRSSGTPFKSGHPSKERDTYQYGSTAKEKVQLATMAATAGFA